MKLLFVLASMQYLSTDPIKWSIFHNNYVAIICLLLVLSLRSGRDKENCLNETTKQSYSRVIKLVIVAFTLSISVFIDKEEDNMKIIFRIYLWHEIMDRLMLVTVSIKIYKVILVILLNKRDFTDSS